MYHVVSAGVATPSLFVNYWMSRTERHSFFNSNRATCPLSFGDDRAAYGIEMFHNKTSMTLIWILQHHSFTLGCFSGACECAAVAV